jgi:hypothetical protein
MVTIEQYNKLKHKDKILLKVLNELDASIDETETKINRQKAIVIIQRVFHGAERHTVSSMINTLLALGVLENNPDSQLSAIQKIVMPTLNSRYFVHKKALMVAREEIISKATTQKSTTLSPINQVKTLTDYTN